MDVKCSVFIAASVDGFFDEITVTWIPVLLGEGIPLFGSLQVERPLERLQTTSGGNGFVQSRYWVGPPRDSRAPGDPAPGSGVV